MDAMRPSKKYRVSLPDEEIDRTIEAILSEIPAKEIYIFGSYARSEEHALSDIDYFVLIEDGMDSQEMRMREVAAGARTYGYFTPVDIIVESYSRYDARRRCVNSVEAAVEREGVKVYG